MTTVTFAAVHEALTECMKKHPPTGHDLRMHPDANVMSGLWAKMVYERLADVEIAEVKPAVLDAVSRWSAR